MYDGEVLSLTDRLGETERLLLERAGMLVMDQRPDPTLAELEALVDLARAVWGDSPPNLVRGPLAKAEALVLEGTEEERADAIEELAEAITYRLPDPWHVCVLFGALGLWPGAVEPNDEELEHGTGLAIELWRAILD